MAQSSSAPTQWHIEAWERLLNANPHDAHHNVHPLALAALVLETPHAVALVVPVRAARAVHAATAHALRGLARALL